MEDQAGMIDISRDAERIHELKRVLLRLGVRPAAHYYASSLRIFVGNFFGGAVVGAAAALLGFAVLGLGAHAGRDSALYHLVRFMHIVIQAVHNVVGQGPR